MEPKELATEFAGEETKDRLTAWAEEGLDAYPLTGRVTLLNHTINTTFRVDARPRTDSATAGAAGAEERFVLRIYRPGTYSAETIRSEVAWLQALRRDEVLGVPEPVPTADGAPLVVIDAESAAPRLGVLFRWLEGRFASGELTLAQVAKIGEFLGTLHRLSDRFTAPPEFERPRFDLDALLGTGAVVPPGEAEELVSRADRQLLDEAAAWLRAELESLGRAAAVEGRPVQVIAPRRPPALPLVDLGRLEAPNRGLNATELGRWIGRRPFDLSRGPLLRLALVRLSAEEHLFIFSIHHIAADGWSSGILATELLVLYEALLDRGPAAAAAALPALPIQYADFAHWQRQGVTGEVLERELGYWRQQLEGAPQVLELPTDRPRPARPSYAAGERVHLLPSSLLRAVEALSQREGCTPFMAHLAAFGLLLSRLTGERDLLIGSPIANRNRGELEGLIGFFANTLVLRTRIAPEASFRELDRRANQLARHLRDLGVGAEVRVGICAERSPELVVGLLAILKAGGAYVPLDPTYPAERLSFMAETAGVRVLLTQEKLGAILPELEERICLDRDWPAISAQPPERPETATRPDQLAYVIFTSGSTGQPKGSMVSHRAIVNRLLWMQEAYGLGAGESVLQKTPFSFGVTWAVPT